MNVLTCGHFRYIIFVCFICYICKGLIGLIGLVCLVWWGALLASGGSDERNQAKGDEGKGVPTKTRVLDLTNPSYYLWMYCWTA